MKLAIFRKHEASDEEERFHTLFVEMYPKLVRYATALMADADEARDIVSYVFERAWQRHATLDEETEHAWLYTAVHNACLNRLKHLKVEQEHIEAVIEATRTDMADNYRQHEALLRHAEEIARNLPEPTRSILRLCYWDKQTYRQVAEHLGISPDTVKKHISKALRTLRETMREMI
ncbi:MAG: RNA polymerase sigma-70 factor, partial [Bacteroidaceae bacterium]|nr:RNA polymerase sigma-70 factor [Bacteroidaceae bacterium]